MKKILLAALLLGMATTASAQLLDVASVDKVAVPADFTARQAVISPDGQSLVVSSFGAAGLSQVNLATGAVNKVSEDGSIFDLKFSDDSRSIVFTKSTFKNRLHHKAVVSCDLATGVEKTLVKASRNINGFDVVEQSVLAVDNKKLHTVQLASATAPAVAPVASIYYGQLMITANGKTTAINPQGKEGRSYLWPSVSPDGTKVVYYLGASGCYVCNIDGSSPKYIGQLRAARWLNNEIIVGMNDSDDGHNITASSIVAADLNGTKQVLTDEAVIAIYPTASADGSKIAFTTPSGEAYIININR